MSNYEQLKADIAAVVRANGIEAITGDRLQQVLTHMVDVLGNEYALAGVATPTTNPPTPDGNTAYIAGTSGTYTYFLDSNYNPLVVPSNCLTALLMYDASAEAWTAYPFGTIAQGTIGTNELADGAVTTPKIADSAVTSAKIGANAVTSAKINNGAVSEQKLATALQNKINDAVTLSTGQTITGDKEFTQPIQALELYGDGDLSVHALDDLTLQSHNGDVEIAADDDINLNGARVFVNTELNVDAGLEVGTDTGGVNSIKATGKILTNGQEVATKAYTDTQLATKQDTIADLDTIRTGAALGATAYQKPSGGIPETDLSASVQTSLGKADTALQGIPDGSVTIAKIAPAAIDATPTANSDNLVTSGGVADAIQKLMPKDTIEYGLWICDESGNAVVRLDKLDCKEIGDNLTQIIQEASGCKDVLEEGFYLTDENGGVLAKYEGGSWVLYDKKRNGFYRRTGDMESGDTWKLTSNSVKNDKRIAFSGTIATFDTLTIGHGVAGQWNASWVVIDDTNITIHNWNGSETTNAYPHGLTISHNIQVEIAKNTGGNATIKIVSDGEVFSQDAVWRGDNGNIYVKGTSSLTNCSFSWTCSKLKDGLWLFGDSFLSVSEASRWTYYLIQDGFLNWVQNGHSGGGVDDNVPALKNLLKIATPRTILWLCNGNHSDPYEGETPDPETDVTINQKWLAAFYEVEYICKQKNIELVLSTFPTSYASAPSEGHDGAFDWQEPKNNFVRNSGYRYIDFNAAVGGDGSGNWWAGMKNPTDIHPTIKGAKSLYQRAISDAPELMQ